MKKILSMLLIIFMLATCLCSCCFHKSETEATCTQAKICDKCSAVIQEAKGHTKSGDATCTLDSVCTVCGELLASAFGHTMPASYSCTEGAKCTVCNAEIIVPTEHTPNEPACDEDSVCTVCHTKLADAKGHTADAEATCTKPSTCTVCAKVLEAAKGHTPGAEATQTSAQICTVCNAILKPATGSGGVNIVGEYIEETVSSGHYTKSETSKFNSAGTVLSYGNYLMEYFRANASGNSNYAKILSNFAAKYPNVSVNSIIVPKCASFHSPDDREDRFENHKSYINATYSMMSGVKTIDAFGEMAKHRGEYLFYRTDHHWTSLGAYYASVAFCNANAITPRSIESYEKVINTGFWGTLYTTYWGNSKKPDAWTDYTVGHLPNATYDFKFSYTAGATSGTNNGTAINKNAKTYASMFIGGDVPFIDIKTSVGNGKKVIVFKESYGNAFVPYLIDYFEEIIVIDMRQSTASVKGLISKYGITDAIIINNIQASSSSSMQSQLKARLES